MRRTNREGKGAACLQLMVIIDVLMIVVSLCLLSGATHVQADDASRVEAEELLERAEKLSIDGDNKENEGRYEEAASLYEEAASLYEKAYDLDESAFGYFDYLGQANCYRKLAKYDMAITTIESGIKKMQASGQAGEVYNLSIYLASIFVDLKEYTRALEIYESQKAYGENDLDWCIDVANVYEQMGSIDNAIASYRGCYKRFFLKDHLKIYTFYVDFLIRNNYLDEAEAVTYAAIVLMQDDPLFPALAYGRLLDIYQKQGRSEELIEWAQSRLKEAEQKREEIQEQPSPEESKVRTWIIVLVCIGSSVIMIALVLILLQHQRKKKTEDS